MRKRVLAILVVLFTSLLTFYGCGDPYKDLKLTLDVASIDLYLELNDDHVTYSGDEYEFTATVTGGDDDIDKNVVLPTSKYVKFEQISYNEGTTKIKVTALASGSQNIVIQSAEGNATAVLRVNVGVKVKSLNFINGNVKAIEEGGTLDFSTNANGYIDFQPQTTTQKNVRYEVVEQGGLTGYAYFDGNVLHSVKGAIYPTENNQRYITVRATSIDNPDLTAIATIPVVSIARDRVVKINSELNAEGTTLAQNDSGEYEVILVPESIGGDAIGNTYATHRTLTIMMGDSNISHSNYEINFEKTNLADTNLNNSNSKVGLEYIQPSGTGGLFTFSLTGVTPSVVRKDIYVDHKDYKGVFTQKITLLIRTINIPTTSGLRVNGKSLDYYESNPLVIFNNYADASAKFGGTPFELKDVNTYSISNAQNFYSYSAHFMYENYGYANNQVSLTNASGQSYINNGNLIRNGATMYLKHDYLNVGKEPVNLVFVFSYSLCPAGGIADDYETYEVQIALPVLLRIGITAEEVDTIQLNYYLDSTDTSNYTILQMNENITASEQISKIVVTDEKGETSDIIKFTTIDNYLMIASDGKLSQGISKFIIYFSNGLISKQSTVTSYIPVFYDTNKLQLDIDESKIFCFGTIYPSENGGTGYGYPDIFQETEDRNGSIAGEYYYKTFSNIIVPNNTSINLNVYNPYYFNEIWGTVNCNNIVLAYNEGTYVTWSNGVLQTLKCTTSIIDGGFAPTKLTLTLSGYIPVDGDITTRIEQSIVHEINILIFDLLTEVSFECGSQVDLYEATSVGAKNVGDSEVSTNLVAPGFWGLLYVDNFIAQAKYNPESGEVNKPIKSYIVNGESVDFYWEDIFVTYTKEGEGSFLQVVVNQTKLNLLNEQGYPSNIVLEEIFRGGLNCTLVARVDQFGVIRYATSELTLYYATKIQSISTPTLLDSGIYFEYRNGKLNANKMTFNYTIYPSNVNNKVVEVILKEGSNFSATIAYTQTGGVVTLIPKVAEVDWTTAPQETLILVAQDSYVLDEMGGLYYTVKKEIAISIGTGSETNKFQIRSIRDLENMLADTEPYYYQLATDIYAGSINWVTNTNAFKGNFSGKIELNYADGLVTKYYSIIGLNINHTVTEATTNHNIGLIGTLDTTGVISDLAITNANIVINVKDGVQFHDTLNVGVLAGVSYGQVNNCQVLGRIDITTNDTFTDVNAGGMIGRVLDVKNDAGEWSTPIITGTYAQADNINGANANANVGIKVTATNANAGGLVGLFDTTGIASNLSDLYVVGAIQVISTVTFAGSVGGVVGYASNITINQVVIIADLYGANVGGVIGSSINYASITGAELEFSNSSALTNMLVASNAVGGFVGYSVSDNKDKYLTIADSFVRSYVTAKMSNNTNSNEYLGTLVLLADGGYAGGFVGYSDAPLQVNKSYFDGDINHVVINNTELTASVAGFVGTNTKSANFVDTYVKGDIVSPDGFKVFSGTDSSNSNTILQSISNLVDKYYQGNIHDQLLLKHTNENISYVDYTINLANNLQIKTSYVALNDAIYSVLGDAISTAMYRNAQQVKTETVVALTYIGQIEDVDGTTKEDFAVQIQQTITTTTPTNTTTVVNTLEEKTNDIDQYSDLLMEKGIINADGKGNYVLLRLDTIPTELLVATEENQNGYIINGVGYVIDGVENAEALVSADAKLIQLLNAISGKSYSTLDGAFIGLSAIANVEISSTSTATEDYLVPTFADVYGTTTYDLFKNSNFAVTTGEWDGQTHIGATEITLKDTAGNVFGALNLSNMKISYEENFNWVTLVGYNDNMPILVYCDTDNMQGELTYSGLTVTGVPKFYTTMYSTVPYVDANIIAFPVDSTDLYKSKQPYLKLGQTELLLTYHSDKVEGQNNQYLITVEGDYTESNAPVINIRLSNIQLADTYFVNLLTNTSITIQSSDTSVVDVSVDKDSNNVITTKGTGFATLSIFSTVDDSRRVDIDVEVVEGFNQFGIYRQIYTDTAVDYSAIASVDDIYINDEISLFPTLTNNNGVSTGTPSTTNGGVLIECLGTTEENTECEFAINGKSLNSTSEGIYIYNLGEIKLKALSAGTNSFRVTPFVYLSKSLDEYSNENIINVNGKPAVLISTLENIVTLDIKARAKSITVSGEDSITVTPDSVVEVNVVVVTYDDAEDLITTIAINGNEYVTVEKLSDLQNISASSKYILDITGVRSLVEQVEENGIITYTYRYTLTIRMDESKYYQATVSNSVYSNPLAKPINYVLTFRPVSNVDKSDKYNYTLKANDLSRFDTIFYANSETSNGEFYPQEVASTKITPGRDGLLKITPQKKFSAINYLEIVTLNYHNYVTLTQLQYNTDYMTEGNPYSGLNNPATSIVNGIRLWNVSSKDADNALSYDNTYYLRVATLANLPQGVNLQLKVIAYDVAGSVIGEHTINLLTENLPTVQVTIEGESNGVVSLNSVTPVEFNSNHVDDSVIYYIVASDSKYYDKFTTTELSQVSNSNNIYLATKNVDSYGNISYSKVDELVNGVQYYLVVSENSYVGFTTLCFVGTREVNGILERTTCTLSLQVVYAKLQGVNILGAGYENGRDVLTLKTNVSSKIDAKINVDNKIDGDIFTTYLTDLGHTFAGASYLGSYIFDANECNKTLVYKNENKVQVNAFHMLNTKTGQYEKITTGTNSHFNWNLITDNDICYISIYTTKIGVLQLSLNINYYYDEYGVIQAINDNVDDRADIANTYNVYTFTHNFVLNIEDNSTEDHPIPVSTMEQLQDMEPNVNYILVNDIILEDWIPMELNVASLDGNGYRLILQSFNTSALATSANIGVFSSVGTNTNENVVTMLKNVTIDLAQFYNTNSYTFDLTKTPSVEEVTFGFLAAENEGCITNCHVISSVANANIKINTYQTPNGSASYTAIVAGLVALNSGSISNSFVGVSVNNDGGLRFAGGNYDAKPFTITAGQKLAGFVANNNGTISNSYVKGVGLTNLTLKENGSWLGGFAGTNTGKIYGSYVEGTNINNFRANANDESSILRSVGTVGGFVHTNESAGLIENAYSKMIIKVNSVKTGGFVYSNEGTIRYAYTTTVNATNSTGDTGTSSWAHGPFVGNAWDALGNAIYGTIEYCYYLILDDEFGLGDASSDLEVMATIDPAKGISSSSIGDFINFRMASIFEGFAITNTVAGSETNYYIWKIDETQNIGPELIQANLETTSLRIQQPDTTITTEDGTETVYNYSYIEGSNYGSKINPVVVNTASRFVEHIVTESVVYDVHGEKLYIYGGTSAGDNGDIYAPSNIRIVNDISFSEQTLNSSFDTAGIENVKKTISEIIFNGIINGNGMTFDSILLTSSKTNKIENYGLFNQVGLSDAQKQILGDRIDKNAIIYNLNIKYEEVSYPDAHKVGVLAGSVYNSTLRNIHIEGASDEIDAVEGVISGANLVGGVAGLISGSDTMLSDITVTNVRISVDTNTLTNVTNDYVNENGYYDIYVSATGQSSTATTIALDTYGNITNLSNISYAGSVAGVITTNNGNLNVDYNIFNQTLPDARISQIRAKTTDINIQNIRVYGNVDITADQAGGVFGYVGYNSHITKTVFELRQGQNTTENFQNIFGYNRAGAIAGEVVDSVLEQVEVRHAKAIQDAIDQNINTIDYTSISNTELFKSSNPVNSSVSLSIGGIAGYAEDSAIIDSYSKVNVTNSNAKVAGGVIGYAKNFLTLGYVYTTGNVKAKDVFGGLIGFYTYRTYKLYLQQVIALNNWDSSIQEVLKNNNVGLAGIEGYDKNKYVMPEIGNQLAKINGEYDTVGDNITGFENGKFVYAGSLIGKATLLPGTYVYNGDEFFEYVEFTIDGTSGKVECTESYIEEQPGVMSVVSKKFTTHITNLFVADATMFDEFKNTEYVCVPLLALTEQYFDFTQTVKKDYTVWYNEYNYNVFSTTYGVLEKYADDISQTMEYTAKSNLLNNGNLQSIYDNNLGRSVENINDTNTWIIETISNNGTINTYAPLLGKQSYLQKITGYFYDSEDNETRRYNNEFNTSYSFTKNTTLSVDMQEKIVPNTTASDVWYKQPIATKYFPEFSYGKYTSFESIASDTDFSNVLMESSEDQYYTLGSDVEVNLTSDNDQQFSLPFMGSIIPVQGTAESDEIYDGRRTITINLTGASNTSSMLNNMNGAIFTNIDFVINVKSNSKFTGGSNGALGVLSRQVTNCMFNNCTFTVNVSGDAINIRSEGTENVVNFGYVFGSVSGTVFNNTQLTINSSSIYLNDDSAGNFGLFAGKLDACELNNFDVSLQNTTFKVASTTLSGNSLNVGQIAGAINQTSVNGLSVNITNTRAGVNNATLTFEADDNISADINLGAVFGLIAVSNITEVNANVQLNITNAVATNNALSTGYFLGYAQSSTLTDVVINENNNTTFELAQLEVNKLFVGGYIGSMLHSDITVKNRVVYNNTAISIPCTEWLDNTVDYLAKYDYLAVGGVVGATLYTNSKDTYVSSISNYYNVADINITCPTNNLTATKNYYIGGIIGFANATQLNECAVLADITSSSNQYGYIGGVVGYQNLNRDLTDSVTLDNILMYGTLHFNQCDFINDIGIRVGGLIGGCGTSTVWELTDSYSYATFNHLNIDKEDYCFNRSFYDIICPADNIPSTVDVTFITESMPFRTYKGIGKEYQEWWNESYDSKVISTLYVNDTLESNIVGYNGSIFKPIIIESQEVFDEYLLNNAWVINDVLFIKTSIELKYDFYIGNTGMLVGYRYNKQPASGNFASAIDGKSQSYETYYVPLIDADGSVAVIQNNGVISNLAIKFGTFKTSGIIDANNGVIYRTSVYGQTNANLDSDVQFNSLANINKGTVYLVGVSVTVTGNAHGGFSGLVGTNYGTIDTVYSTSGLISQMGDQYSSDDTKIYAGIVGTCAGKTTSNKTYQEYVKNIYFAGVLTLKNSADGNNSNIIICSDTTNAVSLKSVYNSEQISKEYWKTKNTEVAMMESDDYNFGLPYLTNIPGIPTCPDIKLSNKTVTDVFSSSEYNLYSTEKNRNCVVRSPYDLIIRKRFRNVLLVSDIMLDYSVAKRNGDTSCLLNMSITNLYGNSKEIKFYEPSKYVLNDAFFDLVNNVGNLKISNITIKNKNGDYENALINTANSIDTLTLNNIAVMASGTTKVSTKVRLGIIASCMSSFDLETSSVWNAVIKNVIANNITLSSSANYDTAGLVSEIESNAKLENIQCENLHYFTKYNSKTEKYEQGNPGKGHTGFIVGATGANVSIVECTVRTSQMYTTARKVEFSFANQKYTGMTAVGGIVGFTRNVSDQLGTKITNCAVDDQSIIRGTFNLGGIAGYVIGQGASVKVSNIKELSGNICNAKLILDLDNDATYCVFGEDELKFNIEYYIHITAGSLYRTQAFDVVGGISNIPYFDHYNNSELIVDGNTFNGSININNLPEILGGQLSEFDDYTLSDFLSNEDTPLSITGALTNKRDSLTNIALYVVNLKSKYYSYLNYVVPCSYILPGMYSEQVVIGTNGFGFLFTRTYDTNDVLENATITLSSPNSIAVKIDIAFSPGDYKGLGSNYTLSDIRNGKGHVAFVDKYNSGSGSGSMYKVDLTFRTITTCTSYKFITIPYDMTTYNCVGEKVTETSVTSQQKYHDNVFGHIDGASGMDNWHWINKMQKAFSDICKRYYVNIWGSSGNQFAPQRIEVKWDD